MLSTRSQQVGSVSFCPKTYTQVPTHLASTEPLEDYICGLRQHFTPFHSVRAQPNSEKYR